ncbi:OmpA family protein [Helicobacter winghamensis]|uniref:Calcium-binding protein n=1 Tax=Helicobacter winghamensis TaxID=157268 RepID=A0A2N3PHJ5_9HELI|nr:OmpA family protein [Helicobacter winghamensis]EEO26512.1 outer membrane porin F family protein [Helicobacter winghamensis ATCC BAA-430]PKT75438.1 calcium-binding protein [Helicobacter winghamensis]PKT75606.1 calcium-binding protein [Helicobacter winghamensis]PKT75814.1 calcium-binding protein [Helicobacter winghamensis]PKT79903.1 calcium-binding protein [Helicobacter winghamensis]
MKKAIALSLVLSSAVFAADNLVEITPQIGGSWHIDNNRYADDIDLSYGLKFATRVMPSVLLEVGYERIDDADYSFPNQSTDVSRYYVDLVKEFNIDSKISPYILGGFGYEHISNEFNSMDSALFGQYGVGVRYALAEFLHLKTELRHLISLDGRSDIIGMVGFSIPFGTYAREVEVVEEVEIVEEVAQPTLSHIHTFSVQFPFDSSVVAPEYNAEIKDFAQSMKENPSQTAIISGHTDSTGNDEYNQKLSERRANAVKDAIIEEGVQAERLQAKGYGESKPIADNATKEGRQENRRVEAEIYTNSSN